MSEYELNLIKTFENAGYVFLCVTQGYNDNEINIRIANEFKIPVDNVFRVQGDTVGYDGNGFVSDLLMFKYER